MHYGMSVMHNMCICTTFCDKQAGRNVCGGCKFTLSHSGFSFLKVIKEVYYFRVIFAVKTALWLLKPGTRDPRLDPFQGFSVTSGHFHLPALIAARAHTTVV